MCDANRKRRDVVTQCLDAFSQGQFVIVLDDQTRENEADLVIAGDCLTEKAMEFLLQHTSGIVCVALEASRLRQLRLPLMVQDNREHYQTAFAITVDAAEGITTGVSAHDRCRTIRLLADPRSIATDFVRPGHIFPLYASPGGVLDRPGHTEAALDLCRLSRRFPCGVLCELVKADHSMMRLPEAMAFAEKYDISMLHISDLVEFRQRSHLLVLRSGPSLLPTQYGDFSISIYENSRGQQHVVLTKGHVHEQEEVPVRIHSECITGDVFSSLRCDCGAQLADAMAFIGNQDAGVIIYLTGHEGRGIGLGNKIAAYALQDQGYDTVEANIAMDLPIDDRDFEDAAHILHDLGVISIALMTHNPKKCASMEACGIQVARRLHRPVHITNENAQYLHTKQGRMGHWLGLVCPTDSQGSKK